MARKLVIFVNGYPRAGKDTFVEFCRESFTESGWATAARSIIDLPVEMLEVAEIDISAKTSMDRRLLADIIVAMENYDRRLSRRAVSDMMVMQAMRPSKDFVGFIHAREPAAIEFMVDLIRAQDFEAITTFVDRPNENRVWSNAADSNVENFNYDVVVKNSGTLDQLKSGVGMLVKTIKSGSYLS